MNKTELKQSGVYFDEINHKYYLNGNELSGITRVINSHVFPHKYDGVPADVLANRANFGHEFHSDMEMYINMGIESDSDAFKTFKENYSDIKFIASEYIVTDGEHFASPIDAIDENGIIYDFKTSTKKDIEYWSWQLGIYCYLFDLQNGISPKGCKVLWINKDLQHELVEIKPVASEAVVALLQSEITGKPFVNPLVDTTAIASQEETLAKIAALEEQIQEVENKAKRLSESRDKLKQGLLNALLQSGIKSWETDRLKISVKSASVRMSVDSKALKEYYPEVYNEVLKETKIKETLLIKLK